METGLTTVVKVGRKGVIVIPKAIRELAGIEEGAPVTVRARGDEVVIKPLRIVRVKATARAREALEKALSEEHELEERKARRIVEGR